MITLPLGCCLDLTLFASKYGIETDSITYPLEVNEFIDYQLCLHK